MLSDYLCVAVMFWICWIVTLWVVNECAMRRINTNICRWIKLYCITTVTITKLNSKSKSKPFQILIMLLLFTTHKPLIISFWDYIQITCDDNVFLDLSNITSYINLRSFIQKDIIRESTAPSLQKIHGRRKERQKLSTGNF